MTTRTWRPRWEVNKTVFNLQHNHYYTMSDVVSRIKFAVYAAFPTVAVFLVLLNVCLAVELRLRRTGAQQQHRRRRAAVNGGIFSFADDASVLLVALALSLLLSRITLSLAPRRRM